jgi:tRNA-specific 2-thiouridylase
MTGKTDSTVAAYLLKKQGYNCIGITLNFVPSKEQDFAETTQKSHDEEGQPQEEFFLSQKDTTPTGKLEPTCYVNDLKRVQAICEKLEIPFYAVNGHEIFKDKVLDPVLTSSLTGDTFSPCIFCNVLKIDFLCEKAKVLGADFVATGHYAKVAKNEATEEYYILAANDTENDQSYFLGGLEKKHLEMLILPFADTRRIEVEKIALSLGMEVEKKEHKSKMCLVRDPRLPKFIQDRTPSSMQEGGTIYRQEDSGPLGDHDGIFLYWVGQKNIISTGNFPLDPELQVVRIEPINRNIYVTNNHNIVYSQIFLIRFRMDKSLDTSIPLKVYAQVGVDAPKEECQLFFKNNNSVLLEFPTEQPGPLTRGQYVVLYSQPGKSGKIVGGGIIYHFGFWEDGVFLELPVEHLEFEEGEEVHDTGGKQKKVKVGF